MFASQTSVRVGYPFTTQKHNNKNEGSPMNPGKV